MIIGTTAALVTGSLLGVAGGIFAGAGSLFFTVGAVVGFAAGMLKYYHAFLAQALVGLEDFSGAGFVAFGGVFPNV